MIIFNFVLSFIDKFVVSETEFVTPRETNLEITQDCKIMQIKKKVEGSVLNLRYSFMLVRI